VHETFQPKAEAEAEAEAETETTTSPPIGTLGQSVILWMKSILTN